MAKEKFITGKRDAKKHQGKASTVRRADETISQVAEYGVTAIRISKAVRNTYTNA